jgi:phosphatidylglycerol---prolipoprotein diacylglyceryl transferase
MYPNLYYFVKDIFGLELNFLKIFNSFGTFVALSFIVSAWVLTKELQRKEKAKLLQSTEKKIVKGKPASVGELITNFLLGFLFGYKILGVLFTPNALDNPQDFILSSQGNLLFGLVFGAIAAVIKWYEFNKLKLDKPQETTVRFWPSDRVGDMVIYAALFGFLGAKLFHNFENWNEFKADPIGALISFSGLTFYGGLICATIAISYYAKKNNIAFWHLADCFAPTMMIAYAIGRIGCQVSGDGDWGILNSAFITDASTYKPVLAQTKQQFTDALLTHQTYYAHHLKTSIHSIDHYSIKPILGLPNWMFAYNYPNNVINDGIAMKNCVGNYCNALPLPVFPTPFYETVVCTIFFGVLVWLRNKINVAGVLFGIYLMLNGIERFLIEKIRVNTVYDFGFIKPTQAEIISTCLFLMGLVIVLWKKFKKSEK